MANQLASIITTACGLTDKLVYFVRGRTAYHYNCPACQIALLKGKE